MKTEMPFEEMIHCLDIVDQTLGCTNCLEVYWDENIDKGTLDFHAEGCPLKGRADVYAAAPFTAQDAFQ